MKKVKFLPDGKVREITNDVYLKRILASGEAVLIKEEKDTKTKEDPLNIKVDMTIKEKPKLANTLEEEFSKMPPEWKERNIPEIIPEAIPEIKEVKKVPATRGRRGKK